MDLIGAHPRLFGARNQDLDTRAKLPQGDLNAIYTGREQELLVGINSPAGADASGVAGRDTELTMCLRILQVR
jgi:hypothetical protein